MDLMDINKFNLMPLNEKAQYTWQHGTFLAIRTTDVYQVNLYHLDNFFAEIFYKADKNSIAHIASFKSRKGLMPYLDRIDIEL